MIEQSLTRGSTCAARVRRGQNSEGARKEQQFIQQTTLKETNETRRGAALSDDSPARLAALPRLSREPARAKNLTPSVKRMSSLW